jgi:hypothetical protein
VCTGERGKAERIKKKNQHSSKTTPDHKDLFFMGPLKKAYELFPGGTNKCIQFL